MIITDYFRSEPDTTWEIAKACGITKGTIRLPEHDDFDVTSLSHLKEVCKKFNDHGIKPIIIEPLPNSLHDHIKIGDELRDESIVKFIALMKNMSTVGIETVCFNFMAHYGWTRTELDLTERNSTVTGFKLSSFKDDGFSISREKMWDNYEYFVRAVVPYAEEYGVKLALHPDDPPLDTLGSVGRIFTSLEAIKKGMNILPSKNLGVTFCQACYHLMGEDLEEAIKTLKDKIFFIHFRNTRGTKTDFRETFHDNGDIDMANVMKLYIENGIDCPVRVDHVPTMPFEKNSVAGYDALGRLFAIGYLKGIIEATEQNLK